MSKTLINHKMQSLYHSKGKYMANDRKQIILEQVIISSAIWLRVVLPKLR
jgi:hypothetical protein